MFRSLVMRSSIALSILAASVSVLASAPDPFGAPPTSPLNNGKVCTVTPLGDEMDDTPQILNAFKACNNGGTVVFPENYNYTIASKLNPVIYDVTVEWRGVWTLSDNITYWANNSYPIAFQNHHAAFIITGERIYINGYGTGGINGNGNTWYNAQQTVTQPGRPMPFVFWNVSDVLVEHFFVKDPPLWSLNIMSGTNMWFHDIHNNATAVNAPYGENWVQNTDGFDTMDSYNIRLTDLVYQGGDDCIAIKPHSYNIYAQNITCIGGNGIAIGSLGQYLEDSSVANVHVKDVNIIRHNNDMETSAYIKTWMGHLVPQSSYESAGLPRGGGWGVVQNIRFENFYVQGAGIGPFITQDTGDNGSYPGTSLMQISNIEFVNFTGYTTGGEGDTTAEISCSYVYPCFNIALLNISLADAANGTEESAQGSCQYIAPNGVAGLTGSGC